MINLSFNGSKILFSFLFIFILSFSVISESANVNFTANPVNFTELEIITETSENSKILYSAYKNMHCNKSPGRGFVEINASDTTTLTDRDSIILDEYEGALGIALLGEELLPLEYNFYVPEDGKYIIEVVYFPILENSSLDINLKFKIDGETLFDEADKVYLPRIYKDETAVFQDSSGNDIRPRQIESPRWKSKFLQDNTGYNPQAFEIFFSAGEHQLTFSVTQGNIALDSINIIPADPLPTYDDVLKNYEKLGYIKADEEGLLIEAENAYEKSSSSIYPINNRADAATTPSDPSYLKLNAINFAKPGDYISWEINVPETGLYGLSFRVLQDANRGISSTRRISIDGKTPFAEASEVEFPYKSKWYVHTLSGQDGQEWLFYFEKDKTHILTLESNTGRLAETLVVIREAVFKLNEVARLITMVTGITPDYYRDYDFRSEIPDLNDRFLEIYHLLENEMTRLIDEMNYEGNELLTVRDILRQLKDFMDDQRSIPSRLGNFRTNISTLGNWLVLMTSQSITIDKIKLLTPKSDSLRDNAGFIEQFIYEAKAIIGSFFIDYNSVGNSSFDVDSITVWVASGRDQANIVRRLIDNDFTIEFDTPTSLSLVNDSATLLQATLAGKGPDIALFVEKTLPVNLAARGAILRLDDMEGFTDVKERFYDSAWVPYTFFDGIYAIPNSQGFNLMFVRTDIFEELEIKVPETWNDFYGIMPVIQRNNMQIGIGGESPTMFETLILQHGGRFYNENMQSTDFDSILVLNAFKMWTGFYREYSLSLVYDAFSYFRSGVMPILIADYTQYNQFVVAAPEIRGLWSMYPIPGFENPDGNINRMQSSTGTGAILMRSVKNKEKGFEFLEWWSRTQTQRDYSIELEMIIGPAARYNTANKEALRYLPWTKREIEIIDTQWKAVWDIETIPSSYYVTRNIANAFRSVVYNKANERETLNRYGEIIDKEIHRKNKELGLN